MEPRLYLQLVNENESKGLVGKFVACRIVRPVLLNDDW